MSEDKPEAHLATLDVTDSQVPSTASAAEQLPEVRAARYRMAEEVGRGGLGRVLRARDVFLDRTVAIKELHSDDEASRRRFVREALITARLQHPSIVPVYEAGRWPDRSPFYAMKLVSGRALSDVLDEKKTLAERLALVPTVLAVADAIAYAHHERIVHRDLKPHNVLVGAFGETVVIDWGLAKDLAAATGPDEVGPYRAAAGAEQTVAGAVLGTPAYMAPEQASGDEVDERTDVYALGAMLYQVIAGVPPHRGRGVDEVLVKILQGDIVPLSQREPSVPPDLAAVVAKAMALTPGDRYPTAAELADDLRRFTNGQLVGAHRYTLGERVRRWIRRHRAVTAVATVAVLVLAVFATWSIRRIFLEIDRADRERDSAVAASKLADEQRDEAIAQANRAVLAQARAALATDHSIALAWLKRMNVEGGGWDAARMIIASALDRPLLTASHDGVPLGIPARSPDGRWVAVVDFIEQTHVWVADIETGTRRHVEVPVFRDTALVWCDDGLRLQVTSQPTEPPDAPMRPANIELETGRVELLETEPGARARARAACSSAWRYMTVDGALLWSDGKEVRTLVADAAAWSSIASTDGRTLAALDPRGRLTWWDGTTVAARATLGPGRVLAAASADASVVGSAEPTPVVVRRDGSIVALGDQPGRKMVLDPAGRWAVVLHADGNVALMSAITGEHIQGLERRGDLTNLRLGADSRTLFGIGSPLHIWDLQGARVPLTLPHDRVDAVGFGDVMPGGLYDLDIDVDSVRMWTRPDPTVWRLPVDAPDLTSGAISPDGRWAVVGSGVGFRRIDVTGATPDEEIAEPGVYGVEAVSDSGAVLRSGSGTWGSGWWGDAEVHWMDGAVQVGERRIPIDAAGQVITVSPDRRWIALGRLEGPADLVDTTSWQVHRLTGAWGSAFAFDGAGRLATGGENGGLLLWDLDRLTSRTLGTMDGDASGAAFSPDGARVVFGGEVWIAIVDLERASVQRLPRRRTYSEVARVQFLPAGDTIVTGDGDSLRFLDVASGESRLIDLYGWPSVHAFRATRDGVVVIGERAVFRFRDDLPREPAALAAILASLPYRLDDSDELLLGFEPSGGSRRRHRGSR